MNQGDPLQARRNATVLESVEEIRAQLRRPATLKEAVPGAVAPADDTRPFRPTLRPPLALLTVLDDGDETGEVLRIRNAVFVIGRVEGDLTVAHDTGMSGRHAELSRRFENGAYRWYLKDLQSTNGTFVRAATVVLYPQQELLIGGRRYRFDAAAPAQPAASVPTQVEGTRKFQALSPAELAAASLPTLVDLSTAGEARRFPLTAQEHWLGRDPRQCSIVVDDPMVDRKHARVYRDGKNRWMIANANSLNGLWARVTEIPLERGGQFQCGEQRFQVRVL
jgi:pSer/pThr/pTyr-binding forkhead associated (FHA) protein